MAILKVPVTLEDHIQGNEQALITLVEYGDYECPYCGFAYETIKKIQNHFQAQLRFIFRNFPLTQIHPLADSAAQTAEFAADHKRFWEMHDLIYENQERLSLPLLFELTQSLKLPIDQLDLALKQQSYEPKIRKDFLGGVRSGVNGTPTFFINDHRYNGPIQFQELALTIEALTQNSV